VAPFRSEAQRKKFAEMVKNGEISQDTFNEWNHATGDQKLPERVERPAPEPKAQKRRRAKFHKVRVVR
jgi:hypothetical protein